MMASMLEIFYIYRKNSLNSDMLNSRCTTRLYSAF
jgi:hypothetical protein